MQYIQYNIFNTIFQKNFFNLNKLKFTLNCTLLECELETDLIKCFDHKVEDVENFSCHRCNYDLSALRGIIDEDDEETLYPDNCRSYQDTKEK